MNFLMCLQDLKDLLRNNMWHPTCELWIEIVNKENQVVETLPLSKVYNSKINPGKIMFRAYQEDEA